MKQTKVILPAVWLTRLAEQTEPAVILDLEYRILAVNPAYQAMYPAVSVHETTPQHCFSVSHGYTAPCDQSGETCPLQAALSSGQTSRALHIHRTPGGDQHVDVETHPLCDARGQITAVLEILRHTQVASPQADAERMVGRSAPFLRMLELIQRGAPSEAAVLLLGETGTGKEMVAQAIHQESHRQGPFVPVECAGLTESLFESELFGHEKGAFTGATNRKIGLVEAARGGTLFLDEVGDIPLTMQVKLLRLLETGHFRRVGSTVAQAADFRLVCATHRDLKAQVAAGEFRLDLYFRISVFPIHLPALRQRRDDIPLLVEALLSRIKSARGKQLTPMALEVLMSMEFPGNIRELRNIVERSSLLADGCYIEPDHLLMDLDPANEAHGDCPPAHQIIPLEEIERRYLARVLSHYRGERRDLAQQLGVSERTLYRKLRQIDGH